MRVLRCAIWMGRCRADVSDDCPGRRAAPSCPGQDVLHHRNQHGRDRVDYDRRRLGNLSASDILAWSLTATTWQNSGSSESVFPSAGLVATQSQLYLNFPTALGSGSTLQFATYPSVAFSTAYGYNSQDYRANHLRGRRVLRSE